MEYRQTSLESSSIQPASQETSPTQQGGGSLPELGNYERDVPSRLERQTAANVESLSQAGVAQPAMLPQPAVVSDPQGASQSNSTVTDSTVPILAADVDLIEKEWVDKAKAVIADTRDDPFQREQEVKKLQIEYVRKRYGRVIGDSNNLREVS